MSRNNSLRPSIFSANSTSPNCDDNRVSAHDTFTLDHRICFVTVGRDAASEIYPVPLALLVQRSKFFDKMWQRADIFTSAEIAFPEDAPSIFELYIHLLYTGKIATRGSDEGEKLCQLYVLAEKLQDINAKNDIVDAMYGLVKELAIEPGIGPMESTGKTANSPFNATNIATLYEGTPAGSPARKFLVDVYATIGIEKWLRENPTSLPPEFLVDLSVRMMERQSLSFYKCNLPKSTCYHESATSPHIPDNDEAGSDDEGRPQRNPSAGKMCKRVLPDRTAAGIKVGTNGVSTKDSSEGLSTPQKDEEKVQKDIPSLDSSKAGEMRGQTGLATPSPTPSPTSSPIQARRPLLFPPKLNRTGMFGVITEPPYFGKPVAARQP